MGAPDKPAMTRLRAYAISAEWVREVRASLRVNGYYYEPGFCFETGNAEPVVTAAKLLGQLYVPSGTDSTQPAILTQPSFAAPTWKPFDRAAAIGWHNDFSTRTGRPELSLSWIRQQDPAGGGAWRVASAAAVLTQLRQDREGRRLANTLSARAEPFGYRDAGSWRSFRIVIGSHQTRGSQGLRFYGRALKDGAWLRFGEIPKHTAEIVARVEAAADAVGKELCAAAGALLVVDNCLSLHDRTEQQVNDARYRRQAWLCFVQKLHRPLWRAR
jgi:Taurine catabolism dioxygenase TauD, TfdA family